MTNKKKQNAHGESIAEMILLSSLVQATDGY